MYKMYRFLMLLTVVHSALAVTEPGEQTLEQIINQIFGVETDPAEIETIAEKPDGCVSVEGRGVGCYECRFCNNSLSQSSRYQSNAIEVLLKNDKCTAQVNVCCVAQTDFLNFRSNDKCGKPNPEGIPRRRRAFVRSVLQAELPWRAWVYSTTMNTPLCAATFIHEDKKALLTLASCVYGRATNTLEVAFSRGGARVAVSEVIQHESYKPGDDNNIVILQLASLDLVPTWASPACLPGAEPPLVTPCIVTTAADLRIDTVIPVRSACTRDNTSLPDALTCALAPPGDYEPELAAGLYCVDQHSSPPTFTAYGIFLWEHQNIASYINIWNYMPWVKNKLHITV